ncbi:hypothetical protein JG789_09370 [Bacillus halotolerans]|uniref:hypothetical protein n=1 Tax=Bacillus halotolerans TaxID=260554 RepID=UPI0018F1BCC6|nr:hypothetical protein [Bacillus halotolerans]MBJ7571414.1 hypothetical protein [Bacillus halotolerans]
MSSEAVEDIECEASALDWIHEYVDSGADLIPETEVHYIYQNTMFLTKAEAKEKENDSEVIFTNTYSKTAFLLDIFIGINSV